MKQIESERREGPNKSGNNYNFASVDSSFTKSREEISTEKIDLNNSKPTARTIRPGKGLNLKKY